MTSSPRRHPPTSRTVGLVVAISVAAHVLLILFVPIGDMPTGAVDQARTAAAPWTPRKSCVGDVLLETSVGTLYCATPFAGADCLDRQGYLVNAGLDTCENKVAEEPPVAVSMMTPREIETVEPKPLEEMLAPEPPPMPEPQPVQPPPPVVAQAPPPPQAAPPPPPRSTQIIETVKPEDEQAPDKARFVSEYDTRVEKETVARGAADEKMVERPGPEELESKDKVTEEPAAPEPRPDEIAREDTDREGPPSEGELAMRRPGPENPREAQEAVTRGDRSGIDEPASVLGVQPKKGTGSETRRRIDAVEPGREGVGRQGGKKKVPDLRPSEDLLARVVGGGSVDHLEGVEEGDETMLNSVGWKHAGFFNRLKRQVAQNWHPAELYSRRDPQGNVYGHKNRRTVVRVSLQPDGRLADIIVVKKSGVDFLDEEAVRAFRAAQPFPNPPDALVDGKTKMITFTFGFHFEVDAGAPWQIIKYR